MVGLLQRLFGGRKRSPLTTQGDDPVCATLYVSRASLVSLTALATLANGGSVEHLAGDDREEWSTVQIVWPGARVRLSRMPEEQLQAHLAGFSGYIVHCVNQQIDAPTYALMQRVMRTRYVIGTVIESSGDAAPAMAFVKSLAEHDKAIVFVNDSVLNALLQPILTSGELKHRAELPVYYSALERKEWSEEVLTEVGIPTLASLPPIVADEETVPRSPVEVVRRAMALTAVAAYGESPELLPQALELLARNNITDALSPAEQAFIHKELAYEEVRAQFCWRYECVRVLLWALGYLPDMKFPTELCDAAIVCEAILDHLDGKPFTQHTLRPFEEILDQADLIYRIHWAVRNNQVSPNAAPLPFNAEVVYERHYALNWLIDDRLAWDEVETDT